VESIHFVGCARSIRPHGGGAKCWRHAVHLGDDPSSHYGRSWYTWSTGRIRCLTEVYTEIIDRNMGSDVGLDMGDVDWSGEN
jgi:hypothetical protein